MDTLAYFIHQLETGMWKDRRNACERLALLGNAGAVHPLIRALDDNDASVREAAFTALGHLNHPLAVGPVILHLQTENEEVVRIAAIHALGWLRNPQAIAPLVSLLKDDKSSIRLAATRALGAIRDARALEPLINRLEDNNLPVRAAACDALGLIKNPGGIRPLIKMLGDTDPLVREKSLEALRRLGEDIFVSAYARALFSEAADVSALQTLARQGDVRVVSALINRLASPWTTADQKDRLEETLKAIYKASLESLGDLFCTAHLSRFAPQERHIEGVGKINFAGCRSCQTTFHVIPAGVVIAVLDEKMQKRWHVSEDILRVNWEEEQRLFDFNRVEIGVTSDKTVTRFCLMINNNTSPSRENRWTELPCDVLPAAGINSNTLQILKRTFGRVRDLRVEKQTPNPSGL